MPGSFYPGGGYLGLYFPHRDTTIVGTRITLIGSVASYSLVATDDGEVYSYAASRVATFDLIANQQHGHD